MVEFFVGMKKGVVIVNVVCGGVVDELVLLEVVNSGQVVFVGLDVFENELNLRKDLLNYEVIGIIFYVGVVIVEVQDRIGLELVDLIIVEFGK